MSQSSVEGTDIDFESISRVLDLADYIIPFTIRTIAGLGVADALASGPRSIEDVADSVGAHPLSLYRALRALASRGIFTEVRRGYFALTPMADLLRTDHPFSLRDVCSLPEADIHAWCQFGHTVRTGEVAFDRVHNQPYWRYFAERPEQSNQFANSMAAWSRLELLSIQDAYDWGALGTVADIGGGSGAFLAGLLARNEEMRGILFDQAHVVAPAPQLMEAQGVADRCRIVRGDFFESVPGGADAYLLKRIIYSWGDEPACRILANIRSAMADGGRTLILEPVHRDGNAFDVGKLLDLQMLVLGGYRSRNRAELRRLLASAGLKLMRVIPTPMIAIVEAKPI